MSRPRNVIPSPRLQAYVMALEPGTPQPFDDCVLQLESAFDQYPAEVLTPVECFYLRRHLDSLVYMAQHMLDPQPCILLLKKMLSNQGIFPTARANSPVLFSA